MKNFLVLALLVSPLITLAQVNSYGMVFSGSGTQTSDLPPDPYAAWSSQTAISSLTSGTLLAGTLGFPGGRSETMIEADGSQLYFFGDYWSTVGELLLDFPLGIYQFDMIPTVGSPDTAFLNIAAVDYADVAPYLTGISWSSLQACAPGVDRALTWTGFNVPGSSSDKITTIQITNFVDASSSFVQTGDPSTFQGVTVPGTFLESGRFYGMNLTFGSFRSPSMGFGGATGYVGTQLATGCTFKVAALPGTISGQLTLDGHVNPSTKVYTVELLDSLGNVLETQSHFLGYSGWYAIDTDEVGVVSVRFDSEGYLSKVVQGVDLSVGQDYVNITLPNGDINEDGEIGPADFSLLALAFGSFPGDPNYSAAADITGDGEVGPPDFAYLAFSFGQFDE